jgi:hypothetical protein
MLCLQAAFTGIPSSHNRWTWRQVLPKELPSPEVIGVLDGKVGLVASSSMPSPGIEVADFPEPPDGMEVAGVEVIVRCGGQSIPSAEHVLTSLS